MTAPESMPADPLAAKVLLKRLFAYVRPYRVVFYLALAATVLLALSEAGIPAIIQPLLDDSFVDKDPQMIKLIPIMIIGLYLFRGVTHYISNVAIHWVASRVVMDLRNKMFDKLLCLPTKFYGDNSSGTMVSKFSYDATQVASVSAEVLITLLLESLKIVGLLSWMFYQSWQLTLVTLIVAPTIAVVVSLASKRQRDSSARLQDAMGDMTHITEEAINGHKVVKVFHGEEYESGRFQETTNKVRRQTMRLKMTTALFVPMVQVVAVCALAIIIYLASMESARENFTVGQFMSFFAALGLLQGPIKRLTKVNERLQMGLAAAQSVFFFIDQQEERDQGREDPGRVAGAMHFENLSHSYDDDRKVLEDFNLKVPAGETVALVGHSGSGKSTLANLVPRFYDPTAGRITIDGIDIQAMTLSALRRNISYVSQEIVLFNDTVAHNIAYGALGEVTAEQIEAAARTAHAWEFIEEMPKGLKTLIGENGLKLSGGQRQRLAIARALLKDAPILILDEATSALDTRSEKYIQEAIEVLKRGRTTLIIAHRLSTIEQADRIVVLDQGRIVESGTHAELLESNGAYAELSRYLPDTAPSGD